MKYICALYAMVHLFNVYQFSEQQSWFWVQWSWIWFGAMAASSLLLFHIDSIEKDWHNYSTELREQLEESKRNNQ